MTIFASLNLLYFHKTVTFESSYFLQNFTIFDLSNICFNGGEGVCFICHLLIYGQTFTILAKVRRLQFLAPLALWKFTSMDATVTNYIMPKRYPILRHWIHLCVSLFSIINKSFFQHPKNHDLMAVKIRC